MHKPWSVRNLPHQCLCLGGLPFHFRDAQGREEMASPEGEEVGSEQRRGLSVQKARVGSNKDKGAVRHGWEWAAGLGASCLSRWEPQRELTE